MTSSWRSGEVRLTPRGRLVASVLGLSLVTAVAVALDRSGAAEPPRPVAGTQGPASPSPAPSPVASVSPRPSPTASPSPSRSRRPGSRRPAYFTAGRDLVVVPGTGPVAGSGRLLRYVVEVEAGLSEDPAALAAAVERTLGDPRGWRSAGRAFQRVGSGPVAFRVTFASPGTTDRLCRPLDTGGIFSCWTGGRAVLNVGRWRGGAPAYGGDLASYRVYMVNHEVGHALGYDHRSCPGSGRPAPVMMQQTKGVGSCRPNPWPAVA